MIEMKIYCLGWAGGLFRVSPAFYTVIAGTGSSSPVHAQGWTEICKS